MGRRQRERKEGGKKGSKVGRRQRKRRERKEGRKKGSKVGRRQRKRRERKEGGKEEENEGKAKGQGEWEIHRGVSNNNCELMD